MSIAADAKRANYRRIAVEEAYLPPDLVSRYLRMIEDGTADDPGFRSLWGFQQLWSDGAFEFFRLAHASTATMSLSLTMR